MNKRNGWLLAWGLLLSLMMSMTAYAGEWRTGEGANQSRWWYDNEDGTYARNGWYWIDGNQDRTAECYYFDELGWLAADCVTPDGYQVNEAGAWVNEGVVETRKEENNMRIQVQANGQTVIFELNDSQAAKMLYEQLPMTIGVENFSSNEKIFYPEKGLDPTGAPYAAGGSGILAYYAPWKNVVMFYGTFRSNSDLYQLGRAVEGSEHIGSMTGTLRIDRIGER
ncbi:cyclophilin-like fold protein [Enterocloster bolteae]|uniref:cyclophilin-like fold protein n=1 Tax=Enterocloster bolteae TaxID=208479 RepID=UPI0028DB06F8|nr:cyclophilin-like fold protein [Enterocloster bolteae]